MMDPAAFKVKVFTTFCLGGKQAHSAAGMLSHNKDLPPCVKSP
jgi:hypothetical protein